METARDTYKCTDEDQRQTLKFVHRPNLERLVALAEEEDESGRLIPVFLALLEVCFKC